MTNAMNPLLELLSHTALKGAAVLLVALLAGLSLRKVAAARRYAIWITAVAALAVLPLAMSLLPAWRVLPQTTVAMDGPVFEPEMPDENPEPILLPVGTKISFPAAAFETQAPAPVKSRPAFSWQDAVDTLPVVWIVLSALLLLRLGWSAWRLHRLERSLQTGTCPALDETAREVGLKRAPHLLIGAENAVPMVWGVGRPRLLLPAGFESWTADKLRGVLLHELAHLKRGDPLALWIAQWVKALHWFNPLAWLTIRQLRADQERACDDAVLRHGVRASDYAQHLLDLSCHTRIAPGLALCALTITRCAPVEARVKAILDPKRHREGLTPRWLLGLAGFALLTTLPVAMLHAIEGAKLRGRILDRNGVVLAESTPEKTRHYPLKTLAAHMIGYTRKTDEPLPKMEGYTGIEKQQDAALAAGVDVTLAFDMRIQSLAHRAMTEAGVTRGAAVVLDPRTGEILAAVSLPGYDPNLFVPSITQENWDRYLGNRDNPLLNRCVKGFTPGSTYKLLTGLAGGAVGISGQKFNCEGSVTYGSQLMQCWIRRQGGERHGELGMAEALAASCSCFWYQFGNAAGIEQIESMGRKIGFGSVYGISDYEDAGTLPSPSWLEQHRPTEKWSNGYTANTSIGQGMVLATPLQMAVLAATVGNGGKVPQPGIIKQNGQSPWRADLIEGTLTAAAVGQLREGMRLVVNGDFAGKAARSDKVIIAGKTGTAQNWRRDANGARQEDNHGWFIGFAPFENPTLAFAIVKNGARSGGGDCAPIAKRIVEEALALPADGSGEVKPVEETADRAPEKLRRVQFERQRDEIGAAVSRAEKETGAGLVIKSRNIEGGSVTVQGEAASFTQAVQFKDKLAKLGKEWSLTWQFPVAQLMAGGDGKRVWFQAIGTVQTDVKTPAEAFKEQLKGASNEVKASLEKYEEWSALQAKIKALEAERPLNQAAIDELKKSEQTLAAQWYAMGVPSQAVRASQMNPADVERWKAMQKDGVLADLPQEAMAHVSEAETIEPRVGPNITYFWFSAPREEVHRWLTASLSEKAKKLQSKTLPWPNAPQPFYRIYFMAGECTTTLHSLDGKTVQVKITKRKRPVMIAPDEATPPRPKTAAPKELDGVVSVENQMPLKYPFYREQVPLAEWGKKRLL